MSQEKKCIRLITKFDAKTIYSIETVIRKQAKQV